jgi:hypothetical protein
MSLEKFYKSLSGKNAFPLEPDSRLYVPIHDANPEKDPIRALLTRIKFAESESVNLLTGFRGNGKSTELRRLKKLLEELGYKVFLVDMLKHMVMVKPVELSDFILSLTTALTISVQDEEGFDAVREGYWERLVAFLNSEVKIKDLTLAVEAGTGSAELALALRTDHNLKKRVQEHLRGHLTTLVKDAQKFVMDIVTTLRAKEQNEDLKVVLLIDSLEQLRGTGTDAQEVYSSVVELFSGQASNLEFPFLHVVYTVPPYLSAMAGNIGRLLGGHPISSWPNIHVRDENGNDDDAGMKIMEEIIAKRYSRWAEFFQPTQLYRLARSSGGDIRDFFRLVRECLVLLDTTGGTKVKEYILDSVEQQLLGELTPIAIEDADWLARIEQSKETSLQRIEDLPRLARFLDGNLIMNYQNGHPWYDVHPLLREEIKSLTSASGDPAGDSQEEEEHKQ